MRNLIMVLLLLTGCTRSNPGYSPGNPDPTLGTDMASPPNPTADMAADTDMAQNGSTDMANAPDMVQQITGDMAQAASSDMANAAQSDMAQASADMVTTPQPDMTTPPDMTQLPPDLSGPTVYTHHDTFCNDSWTDNNSSVNPQLVSTAMAACSKCCADVTGSTCSCTDHSMVSVGGYAATVSYLSFNANGSMYWFYYYDSNFQLKSGKGEQYLTGVGLINSTWWDQ